jgi:hypothetical protein
MFHPAEIAAAATPSIQTRRPKESLAQAHDTGRRYHRSGLRRSTDLDPPECAVAFHRAARTDEESAHEEATSLGTMIDIERSSLAAPASQWNPELISVPIIFS